ncbi:TlpA family protein disulfide reductase [Symbiobacterium thermophilum]|jgi:thiol-disulfide isomerase/thioredoxin|uniref:Thiol-disulfide isomerase and thioredoxins n=2 Tax=Symbiobacterium thermophilum TaxID=2734 RepID=Q67LA9_SYMTH|nr:TlpA disulfide reductase family protein [Symbiobacterium thermophilum]MBY6274854.1 TlpA family protein disulfide reductase [Symbiobacterium thermophilum]BAD41537.1 thiol-disulfide isomerase and thioredoxins [Symbiobacterium thermophilum IAM 14863]
MSVSAKPGAARRPAQAVVLLVLALLLAGCGGLQRDAGAAGAGSRSGAQAGGSAADQGTVLEVKPVPGYLAADIRAKDVFTGEVLTLSDLKGTPVLLNFWATWCGPCREEMPEMEEFHQEMGDAVRVVAVSADSGDSPEKMAAFAEALGLTFSVVHDGGSAARAYRVGAIPTSFFIDGEGVIQVRYTGPLTLEQMKEYAELASNTAEDPEHP